MREQVRGGGFDWSGRKNLTGFVRAAGEAGLWVLLRPGPYVGAEYVDCRRFSYQDCHMLS